MTRYLIEKGAELDAVDNEGDTALTTYMWWLTSDPWPHQIEFIRFMVERGADINRRNKTGQSGAWHWICAYFYADVLSVQWLLDLGSTISDERKPTERIFWSMWRGDTAPVPTWSKHSRRNFTWPTTTTTGVN